MKKIKFHPGLIAIILFGSYSKSENKPISDIDIAVILKNPSPEDEADLGSLYSDRVDLVLFHRLPLHIQYEVLKYGKEIFVKDEEEFLKIKMNVLRDYLDALWLYKKIESKVLR